MVPSLQDSVQDFTDAVRVHGAARSCDIVLICEHASADIPAALGDLGLSDAARFSHAAWDIGAADMAQALSDDLGAPLVLGGISRLVYDCNRPLDAADCIPAQSEVHAIPGNAGLPDAERARRFEAIHQPFHDRIVQMLDAAPATACVVTIHSFTPVYHGQRRDLDIGYLCDSDDRLARAALRAEAAAGCYKTGLNAPYSASDGVTHTLQLHGTSRGLANVMIEVRNDLIDTPPTAAAMAAHLAGILRTARAEVLG